MRFDSLDEWLRWLEDLHHTPVDLGLERVKTVARAMQLIEPQRDTDNHSKTIPVKPIANKIVVIGGTNGKGSCVRYLSNLLQKAGLRTACYTSPHLLHFRERLCIDDQPVDNRSWCEALQYVDTYRQKISLTYFEFTVLGALYIIQSRNVDVAILEIGLGGRLDAVNIVEPDISIITSIDIDHVDWLGDNREDIGMEKAAIFRSGGIAICGDDNPPDSVISTVEHLGCAFLRSNRDFKFVPYAETMNKWQGKKNNGMDIEYKSIPALKLPSRSASCALQAVTCLNIELEELLVQNVMEHTVLPGRMQAVTDSINWILDVAHNPAATKYLYQQLYDETFTGRTYAVTGILNDKDSLGILQNLYELVDYWCLLKLQVEKAKPPEEIRGDLIQLGVDTNLIRDFDNASVLRNEVLVEANENDRVIVFGSFYTVAALLEVLHRSDFCG